VLQPGINDNIVVPNIGMMVIINCKLLIINCEL